MSASDETSDHHPDDPLLRIDKLCDLFEDELRRGARRSVDEFLRGHGLELATADPELVRELARLEAEPSGRRPTERFPSGTVLARRYRIIAQLGKGGMGEVYRAYDLNLCKEVALKFLSDRLADIPAVRAQFFNEVRAAHEVSNEHVCRMHDVHDHDGQPFLTMAYIDGEDLASLLKRINRLTQETAAEYARQLCVGLAAVHDKGIVHRDLKPLNIMIDGRGKVRITDFGLAGVIGSFADTRGAGTPHYQAPEQLAGGDPTFKSDLFALGVVLYEMFTGKRAFEATTREELVRLQEAGLSKSLSETDLKTSIVTTILECLRLDPAKRPSSPKTVLFSMLSAGGTPSSEQTSIADPESERAGRLSPRVGLFFFALALVTMVLAAWLNDHVALFRQTAQDLSPRDLSVRARRHLERLGYDARAADSASGIATDEPLLKHLRDDYPEQLRHGGLRSGQPAVMYFWYRQSPQPLAQRLAANDTSGWSMPGRVLPNEPPLREPGMTCVFLDLEGRLLEFHGVPERESSQSKPEEPDPKTLLDLAGFTGDTLRESNEFLRVPSVFADRQMAWEGYHPKAPEVRVRIEAAFCRGKPVYFYVGAVGDPDRLIRSQAGNSFMPENPREHWQERKNMLLGLIALPIGGWFAWRNWKSRRANPRGASILSGTFVVLGLVGWLFSAKHVPAAADELSIFTGMLGRVLFDGLLLWMAYLALEPWVRRKSPGRVISWNRLLEGKWSDPLVGHDVLIGVVAGCAFVAMLLLMRALPGWFGHTPDPKIVWDASFTEGAGALLLTEQIALMVALRSYFLFFLTLLICRRAWLASILNAVVWSTLYAHGGEFLPVICFAGVAYAVASLLVLLRAGLVGFIAFHLAEQTLIYMPVTTDFSAWYAGISTLSLLLVMGLAAYGFWAACRQWSFFTAIRRD